MKKLILLSSACLSGLMSPAQHKSDKPNIIFFLVDDMGWQETSVPFWTERTMLNDRYHTPNMEALAAMGMKFTQAYACPLSSPTRVSLMTGMNAARHQVPNWTLRKDKSPDINHKDLIIPDWNMNGISPVTGIDKTMQVKTLPMFLREAGYTTIHVGKAHWGAKGTPGEDPVNLGFDVNIAGHAAGGPGSYWGKYNFSAAWRNEDRIWDVPGLEKYAGQDIYLTEALTLEALGQMEKVSRQGKPFYLYMSHYAIHAPWEKDDRFYQKYKERGLTDFEATYASMIEGMDKSLGDILQKIQELGIGQNTIIIFMSDNGSPSQCPRNLPLRGHKITPYEGGIRDPMIVHWPGVTAPGSVCGNPVIIEDFFPSILEMAGVKKSAISGGVQDGKSFLPLLKGKRVDSRNRQFIWHFPHNYDQEPYSVIRQGDWKLIYWYNEGKKELYNIREDISEKNDLAAQKPGLVDDLAAKLGNYLREVKAGRPSLRSDGNFCPWPDSVTLPNGFSKGKPIDVILYGGQSNATGQGYIKNIPSDFQADTTVLFFYSRWLQGKGPSETWIPLGQASETPDKFGAELSLGTGLHRLNPNRKLAIIKHALSGSNLYAQWNPGRNISDSANWGPEYRKFVQTVEAGLQQLREAGYKPRIRAMCWQQGEADARDIAGMENSRAYGKNFRHFITRVREQFHCQDMLFVYGYVIPVPLPRFTGREEVRQAQHHIDQHSGHALALKGAIVVETDDLPLRCDEPNSPFPDDKVHFNTKGMLELGRRYALAIDKNGR